jgi:hypothetical protein
VPAEDPAAKCGDIAWQRHETCPPCEDDCVVLATIVGYAPGDRVVEDDAGEEETAVIDNRRGRRLLPSTQTLAEIVECLIAQQDAGGGGGGETPDPTPSDPGSGLSTGLTAISALGWEHAGWEQQLTPISDQYENEDVAVVVAFDGPVRMPNGGPRVFELLTLDPESDRSKSGLECWCSLVGRVLGVTEVEDDGAGFVKGARVHTIDEGEAPETYVGLAFLFGDRPGGDMHYAGEVLREKGGQVRVRLHGDFVIDEDGNSIAAAFVRGELPTGDLRPRPVANGTPAGLQGGVFESWFGLGPQDA